MIYHNKKESKVSKKFFENLISIFSIILLIFIFIYKIWLIKIEEFFELGSEIGEVFYNLSLSIIASSLFYYLVVFIPEKRNKNKVRQVINMRFEQIQAKYIITYADIKKKSDFENAPKNLPDDIETFKSICRNMMLTERPPDYFAGSTMVPLNNWFEYFEYNFRYDDKDLDILYKYSAFLNKDTLQLMHDLLSHNFRTVINQYHYYSPNKDYAKKFDSLSYILYNYLITLKKFSQNSWA